MEQKSEKTKEHVQSHYHQKSMQSADNLKFTIEHPNNTIICKIDACKATNIECNRSLLKSIARAILYCALPYEEIEKILIHLVIIEIFLHYLRCWLFMMKSSGGSSNAKCNIYVSQNELIEVMGNHMILQSIIDDVNSSPFYSILADKVASHNVEHLAICIR